ncbi:hypothetical protein PR048_004266 [Dryococelus australis]|uniref:Uncharacterized protein n=1 Tax=Dryococelus australis TaxID=614101 RepID=A0ABQ9I4Z9_9NEOP|nr:hypothetical protein PR048_004266 [Dryococelus australis]
MSHRQVFVLDLAARVCEVECNPLELNAGQGWTLSKACSMVTSILSWSAVTKVDWPLVRRSIASQGPEETIASCVQHTNSNIDQPNGTIATASHGRREQERPGGDCPLPAVTLIDIGCPRVDWEERLAPRFPRLSRALPLSQGQRSSRKRIVKARKRRRKDCRAAVSLCDVKPLGKTRHFRRDVRRESGFVYDIARADKLLARSARAPAPAPALYEVAVMGKCPVGRRRSGCRSCRSRGRTRAPSSARLRCAGAVICELLSGRLPASPTHKYVFKFATIVGGNPGNPTPNHVECSQKASDVTSVQQPVEKRRCLLYVQYCEVKPDAKLTWIRWDPLTTALTEMQRGCNGDSRGDGNTRKKPHRAEPIYVTYRWAALRERAKRRTESRYMIAAAVRVMVAAYQLQKASRQCNLLRRNAADPGAEFRAIEERAARGVTSGREVCDYEYQAVNSEAGRLDYWTRCSRRTQFRRARLEEDNGRYRLGAITFTAARYVITTANRASRRLRPEHRHFKVEKPLDLHITYSPAGSPANREPFAALSSQSDTTPVSGSSRQPIREWVRPHRRNRHAITPLTLTDAGVRGGLVVRTPPSTPPPPYTQVTRARFSAGSLPNFRMWESCRTMPLFRLVFFFRGSPVFPRPSIPALLRTRLVLPWSALKASMLRPAQISSFAHS